MTKPRSVDRRRFLAGSAGAAGAAVLGRLPLELLARQAAPRPRRAGTPGACGTCCRRSATRACC